MQIQDLLKLVKLTDNFRHVDRMIFSSRGKKQENDAEHSYQLALMAWYITQVEKLPFDTGLLVRYALVHDLVEVYAGDTFIYSKDTQLLHTKHEREAAAAERLRTELPEFHELHALIERYEQRSDEESKFIYALDKILPILNIYLEGGAMYKEQGITLDMLLAKKESQVKASPVIEQYFKDIVKLLEDEQQTLFGPTKEGVAE